MKWCWNLPYAEDNAIVTYNKSDFEGVDKFGIDVQTPGEFLRVIGELI